MYDTAAESQGKVFVTTELGGGGSSTARSVAIAERGVRNLLVHAGILEGELQTAPSIMLDMPDGDCFIASEHDGLLEMCRDLGDNVNKGDVIARVYDATRSGVAPVEYRAARSGLLAARHFPGLVGCGDTIAVIAEVLT
jgi:N-alpha-acetyl-L-2,4-diaminobutyrate deacetylase